MFSQTPCVTPSLSAFCLLISVYLLGRHMECFLKSILRPPVCFLSRNICLFAVFSNLYSDPVCDAQPVFIVCIVLVLVLVLFFLSLYFDQCLFAICSDPVCDAQPVCPDCDKVVSVDLIIKTNYHHHVHVMHHQYYHRHHHF